MKISRLKNFAKNVGISDHSNPEIYRYKIIAGSLLLGADIVEKHFTNPNCFCIDAFKLLSLDYNLFEEEYMRIVKRFNFTNNVERVRDFVQLYRKRESQVSEWYKNDSFPTPSQL